MIEPIRKFFEEVALYPTQVLPNSMGALMFFTVVLALKNQQFWTTKFLSAFKISRVPNSLFYFFSARLNYKFLDPYDSSYS